MAFGSPSCGNMPPVWVCWWWLWQPHIAAGRPGGLILPPSKNPVPAPSLTLCLSQIPPAEWVQGHGQEQVQVVVRAPVQQASHLPAEGRYAHAAHQLRPATPSCLRRVTARTRPGGGGVGALTESQNPPAVPVQGQVQEQEQEQEQGQG